MKVVYMCHPVRGDVPGNIRRAKAWVRRLEEENPDVAIVATWITECEVWDDADEEQRKAGLARDLAVIERCDELWLVGPRISDGMQIERDHAIQKGLVVRHRTMPGAVECLCRANFAFQKLWTRATNNYKKTEWVELEQALYELGRRALEGGSEKSACSPREYYKTLASLWEKACHDFRAYGPPGADPKAYREAVEYAAKNGPADVAT